MENGNGKRPPDGRPESGDASSGHPLRLVGDTDGPSLPQNPRSAGRVIVSSVQRELLALAEQLGRAVDLAAEEPGFDDGRFYGGPPAELIPSRRLMNERLAETINAASEELCTVQTAPPGDRDPEVIGRGLARDRDLLERGARVRYLYTAASLEDEQTVDYLAEFLQAGGEARVGPATLSRMVLVDCRHLFVDVTHMPGDPDAGWHIQDIAPVTWIRNQFERAWSTAMPWDEARARVSGAVSTARQRQILRALEEGCSQQQVADRVHLSDRVVNRELSVLRQALGMRTTNQALIWWGGTPERELP
ncbi:MULTISPECIES: hypothetical protein [unclassified Streptomyces]|uniref:hypothetical protein n=1 Tax=unclassified Streptomyces TaxID=2593676 RepID=UPI0035E121BC